jgi:hypothetical protein
VPENMRAHRLCNTSLPSIDGERVLDPVTLPEASRGITLGDKECLVVIRPSRQVALEPRERTVGEEEDQFLLPFPMILASLRSQWISLRFRDKISEILAPVPRSTSTSARKQSRVSGTASHEVSGAMIASTLNP